MKQDQKSLASKVKRFITDQKLILAGERVMVAVSGGPDSVCLFEILFELKDQLKITLAIAHYHHGQRGREADLDAAFVESIAKKRGVPYFFGCYNNISYRKLSEDEARAQRYKFLGDSLGEWSGDRLVIAHTASDQAETILFRLIRGSGIFGLFGIPLRRDKICRPLLPFTREEVLQYLTVKKLKYRLDRSNLDLKFSRNRLRHKVIPELLKINSSAQKNIVLASERLVSIQDLIEQSVNEKLKLLIIRKEKNKVYLNAEKFNHLSPTLRLVVLYSLIRDLDVYSDITEEKLRRTVNLIEKNIGNKHLNLSDKLQIGLEKGIIKVVTID